MLTAEGVTEVSFTAEPARLGSWSLTIEDLVKMTSAADWDSWIRLWPEAAARIAGQLNALKPWKRSRRPALSAGPTAAPLPPAIEIIEGELVG
jgi:hypothetical protein